MPSFPTVQLWENSFHRHFVEVWREGGGAPSLLQQAVVALTCILCPVVIGFLVLLWPIGYQATASGEIGTTSFLIFQAMYTTISFPIIAQVYDFALPGSPKWLLIVIYIVDQVVDLGFFYLYTSHYSLAHLALVRTMGPVFNAVLVIIFYTAWFIISARRRAEDDTVSGVHHAEEAQGMDGSSNLAARIYGSAAPSSALETIGRYFHSKAGTGGRRRTAGEEGSLVDGLGTELRGQGDASPAAVQREVYEGHQFPRPGMEAQPQGIYQDSYGGAIPVVESFPSYQSNSIGPVSMSDRSSSTHGGERKSLLPFRSSFGVQRSSRVGKAVKRDLAAEITTYDSPAPTVAGSDELAAFLRKKTPKDKALSLSLAFFQLCGVIGTFLFCQSFTLEFFSGNSLSTEQSIGLASAFMAIIEVVSYIVKLIGRQSDRLKSPAGGISCELASEVYMSCFYCIFYRSLFQHVSGWGEFVGITAIHIFVHSFTFPFRLTKLYFRLSTKVMKTLTFIPCLYDDSNPVQWNTRLSIDHTVRFFALLMSSLAYMVSVTFIRYGYNSKYYASFFGGHVDNVADFNFQQLLMFQGTGCLVDILAAIITAIATRSLVPGGVFGSAVVILSKYKGFLFFFVMSGAHIITDVFLARVALDIGQNYTNSTNATVARSFWRPSFP